jgi:hypothetical protein
LAHHLDVVLQPVLLDGLEHERLMIAEGARQLTARQRRHARKQRILALLLGPPCRAQPGPGLGRRPRSELIEHAVGLGAAQLRLVLGVLADRPEPAARQRQHADEHADPRQRQCAPALPPATQSELRRRHPSAAPEQCL